MDPTAKASKTLLQLAIREGILGAAFMAGSLAAVSLAQPVIRARLKKALATRLHIVADNVSDTDFSHTR